MFLFGCSHPERLTFNDNRTNCLWTEGGGSPSRTAYVEIPVSGTPHLVWQKRFLTPLVIEPTSALGVLFVPTTNRKLSIVSVNDGLLIAEINLGEPVSAPCCLQDSLAVLNEDGLRMRVENWISRKLLWEVEVDGAWGEPLIFEGLIYWLDDMRKLNCFNLLEGKRLWDQPLKSGLAAPPTACSSGVVLAFENGTIECLSPFDGSHKWTFDAAARIRNSPVIFQDNLIFSTSDGDIVRLSMPDGSRIWLAELQSTVFAPLATDGEGVFVGTNDRRLVRLDFETGAVDWTITVGGPIKAGAVIVGDLVVFAGLDHKIYFVDKNLGMIKSDYLTGGMLSARPIACQDRIFVPCEDKNLYCFQISGEK